MRLEATPERGLFELVGYSELLSVAKRSRTLAATSPVAARTATPVPRPEPRLRRSFEHVVERLHAPGKPSKELRKLMTNDGD